MSSAEQREDTHDVIANNYVYLWGMAIHKHFFKYWTVFIFTATTSCGLILIYTNWWQLFITSLLTLFFIKAWYIGFPTVIISSLIGYVLFKRRQKRIVERRKTQSDNDRIRQLLLGGGDRK